jgi:hypothetical protein
MGENSVGQLDSWTKYKSVVIRRIRVIRVLFYNGTQMTRMTWIITDNY